MNQKEVCKAAGWQALIKGDLDQVEVQTVWLSRKGLSCEIFCEKEKTMFLIWRELVKVLFPA